MLALGAAFANTGLVLRTGASVSHLTGDIARFNIGIGQWSQSAFDEVMVVAMAAIGFLVGATLAGFIVHHPTIDISRPYGRCISFIGVFFLCSSWLIERQPFAAIALAALACGFQNALATHYRGLVLRTTHLTGMFTDLGVNLGMKLHGYEIPIWKIVVPFLLIFSFCFGGFSAALLETAHHNSIQIAGIAYCLAGLSWSLWKRILFTPQIQL